MINILGWTDGIGRPMRLALAAMLGVVVGLALYVGRISEAASYLSDDPRACINCHIMFPEYATWQHSSHREDANCNDCHVPHTNVLAKYYFKAKDGLRHSVMFTFRLEPEVIEAIPESREVIQGNCIRCHTRVMMDVANLGHNNLDRSCVDCHREVPHGRTHSLSSTPNAAVPALSPLTPEWMRQWDTQ